MTKIISAIILFVIGLGLLLGLTSPNHVSLLVYLAVFIIIYFICLLILLLILNFTHPDMSMTKRLFIATVLAFAPIILLALNTISTLSLLDILLACGVPSIIVWYGFKRGF
jgi:hypothetical protein